MLFIEKINEIFENLEINILLLYKRFLKNKNVEMLHNSNTNYNLNLKKIAVVLGSETPLFPSFKEVRTCSFLK